MPTYLTVEVRPFLAHMSNQALDYRNIWGEQGKANGEHDQAKRDWQGQDDQSRDDKSRSKNLMQNRQHRRFYAPLTILRRHMGMSPAAHSTNVA